MRLQPLCFLPPPAQTPWSGAPHESNRLDITRHDGVETTIELPLFWYDPPWCDVSSETADTLATVVGRTGVLVSALRSDLAGPERQPQFHAAQASEGDESEQPAEGPASSSDLPPVYLPRVVPYRPERYGLDVRDFDGAKVIDVRLAMTRDASGRFAFSPSQIQRWEATPASEPLAGGGWVPAATFPPDVVSLEHLSSKLAQLRMLAPTSAIFISMGPYRMETELPAILSARPDGLILQLDETSLEGLQVAAITRRARQMMNESAADFVPLWIVPGEISPDDAVKLMALGASGVAVDSWCDPMVAEASQRQQSSASRLGYASQDEEYMVQLAHYQLSWRIERFRGLSQSILRVPPQEQLGSFSAAWAEELSIKAL